MTVDKELLEIQACPSCRGDVELRQEADAEWIVCLQCGLRYPVRDGIPVMLVEEAKQQ
jgi:uncharacterized protein YbaR (Trm112 family)